MNGEVLIVDEHTGRMLAGRRYNEGMHQAIEAKEGVEIQNENQTLATITLQNYFRMYDKLSGMTGTAQTEAAELQLDLQAGRRADPDEPPDDPQRPGRPRLPHRGGEVRRRRRRHRRAARRGPAGARRHRLSVEKSEYLSDQLRRSGIPHEVLNAKHHEREAAIVAQAGRKGAVTVATNMAGRGTDIMLGGNPEFMAVADPQAARASTRRETPEEYEAAWDDALAKAEEAVAAEHDEVTELGGLYVLGTERHESRRIDNQLRGRSGRQGDPGESRFYLSLQDDLMRLFNAGHGRPVHDDGQDGRTTCRSSPRWSPARSRARRRQVEAPQLRDPQERPQVRRRPQPPAHRHLRRAPPRARGRGPARADPALHQRRRRAATSTPRPPRASPRTGTSTRCGPRCRALYPVSLDARGGRRGGRRPQRADQRESSRRSSSPTPTTPTTSARRRSAPRSCARSSAASCSRCSTASGASTSTRWTTSRRASACGRWPSATRSSSTSARASSSSRR